MLVDLCEGAVGALAIDALASAEARRAVVWPCRVRAAADGAAGSAECGGGEGGYADAPVGSLPADPAGEIGRLVDEGLDLVCALAGVAATVAEARRAVVWLRRVITTCPELPP